MKRKTLFRLLSILSLVLTLGTVFAHQDCLLVNASEPDIILKLELPSYEITQDDEGLDIIQVEGFNLSGPPGTPLLPRKVYNVAVPPEAALDSLSLKVVDAQVVKLPGVYYLKLATPDLTSEGIKGDVGAYQSSYAPAPDTAPTDFVKLLPYGQMRKWRFTRLEFAPFRYDATSGELSVVSELTVRINYDLSLTAQDTALLRDKVMDDVAQQFLVNYDTAQVWYQTLGGQDEPSAVNDYVIITTNAIKAGSSKLASFIAHKQGQGQGYRVRPITEDQYGSLSGQPPDGTAEKIRKWLQDNYIAYSIKYVLLIGDPDPDDPSDPGDSVGDVPMKMCWPLCTTNSSDATMCVSPTDYFFADLTGDWNLDGDQYFGEWGDDTGVGGVDFANEVYVGRIPVYGADYSTLDNILQKIMDYENETSPESWRKSSLLPMSFSTELYDGAPLAEQMKDDYLDSAGFSSWTQYQQGSGKCGLDSAYPSDEELRGGTVVRDRWAANDYGLVLWWGHGSAITTMVGCDDDPYDGVDCWDGTLFSSSYVSWLDDDHPSFVYQNSCLNGYPENANNLQYALLKQGGIATVSATRVSWFNTAVGYGDFDGSTTNSGIGYEYAKRLIDVQAAGDALYNAKSSMSPPSKTRLMNFYDFNLYGDPSTVLSVEPLIPGKIVVANDEWPLSDEGFPPAPDGKDTDAAQFALNVASWFTGGTLGNFLVYSTQFGSTTGLVGAKLENTMTATGHTWTIIDTPTPFSLNDLLPFDGIFLAGTPAHGGYDPPDNQVLIDYVKAGGNVYLAGGTDSSDPAGEANQWNRFLRACGLDFAPVSYQNGLDGTLQLVSPSSHPIFDGVQRLYQRNGSFIRKRYVWDPNAAILVRSDQGIGLYAVCSIGAPVEGAPTAIDLLSFTAEAGDDRVTLAWETGTEVDNAGFNIWRSEAAEGPYTKINDALIPAEGDAVSGASYTYTDTDVVKGVTYYYKLEDVDIHGISAFHGPVSATPSPIHPIYLPLLLK